MTLDDQLLPAADALVTGLTDSTAQARPAADVEASTDAPRGTLGTLRMMSTSLHPSQTALQLGPIDGGVSVAIEPGGFAAVPYAFVRGAISMNWVPCSTWPPRPGTMEPPEPFADDAESVEMPDGTLLPLPRPHGQTLVVPIAHVAALEAEGWLSLTKFA